MKRISMVFLSCDGGFLLKNLILIYINLHNRAATKNWKTGIFMEKNYVP
jgi:hypothetical protein